MPSVVSICTGEVLPPQGMAVSSGTAPTEADQEEEPGRSLQIKAGLDGALRNFGVPAHGR